MNKKTLIALALLLTVLFTLSLFACDSEDAPDVQQETTDNAPEQSEEETEAETKNPPPTYLPDELPDANDLNINLLIRTGGYDLCAEEILGETINDAVYKRNAALYDKYGVEVTQVEVGVEGFYEFLYAQVAGGDDSLDAVNMNLMASFSAASNGLLLDLETDIPYIDLDKPWWDQRTRENFSIKNKLYYTCSDINLTSYGQTWVCAYNKGVISDLGYDDDYIYDLVRDGKWTLDAYYDIIKGFTKDLNNDNKMTSVDQYGTSFQGSGPEGFILCSGFKYCTKNEEDELVFNELDDRGLDMLAKVMKVSNGTIAYNSHNQQQNDAFGENSENGRNMFWEERSIFYTETLQSLNSFRDVEQDFGIIPLPKYDEEGDYTSFIHHWGGSAIAVPTTAPDLEKTGMVLEYMAYLSSEITTPAYFNMMVQGKFSRDDDSYEMIEDYIMANRVFDLVMANRINGLPDTILTAMNNNMGNFASIYKRSTKAIVSKLDEINEAFE